MKINTNELGHMTKMAAMPIRAREIVGFAGPGPIFES